MTYVSEYFHRFAQQDLKEIHARRAQKFIRFAQMINTRKAEYEARVKALLQWLETKEQTFSSPKFGETVEDANQTLADLKNYYLTEKPPKIGERMDVETLFADIQTLLKVNDRAPYVPPEALAPASLDSAWEHVGNTEKKYAEAVRVNRFRFVRKEDTKLSAEKIAEFKDSFMHFDNNKDDAMDRTEFKAANAAMSIPFKNEDEFNKVFNEVAEGKTSINLEQYMRYMTSLQEDRDSPEQLLDAFRALASDAPTISAAQLNQPPLSEDDSKFLQSEMVQTTPGQFDYREYVARNFPSSGGAGTTPQ